MKKTPRQLAYEIIYEVKYSKAYSNIAINKALKNSNLNYRERGFLTELVYGTLSRLLFLDQMISQYSHLPKNKLSKKVSTILQMGIYQLMFMDSVTDFAGVSETVELVKAIDFRSSGFVNGVMRSIAKDFKDKKGNILDLSSIKEKRRKFSIQYSVSEYLAGRFLKQYGEEFASQLLESLYQRPDLFVRVNRLKVSPAELYEKLEADGIVLEKVPQREDVFSVKGMKGIGENPYFQKGYFSVQDLSSMMAVEALNPKPGEKILDICSAPGGKSFYMAERMNNKGWIDAQDISENKLRLLSQRAGQLGLSIIHTKVCDAEILQEAQLETYDKILVDAPCSGYGIIRRKPEIRYKNYEDVCNLPVIQSRILSNASKYLKPGGRLVYSTCTLEKKENTEIIEAFLSANENFVHEQSKELYPHLDGMDGFFIASLEKLTGDKI